jgi:hypothetical protein
VKLAWHHVMLELSGRWIRWLTVGLDGGNVPFWGLNPVRCGLCEQYAFSSSFEYSNASESSPKPSSPLQLTEGLIDRGRWSMILKVGR